MDYQNDTLKLLVEIANKYYHENASQEEIGDQFNMSRSLVSRYLTKARELGIVEFVIHDELIHPFFQLESQLKEAYGLKDVICVQPHEDSHVQKQRIAVAAGKYLVANLRPQSIVAIAGGTTINEVAHALYTPKKYPHTKFVSVVGGVGNDNVNLQSNSISEKFATKLGGTAEFLYAPVLIDSASDKLTFQRQTFIKQVFQLAREADFALMGIGGSPLTSTIANAYRSYLDIRPDIERYGIIGDLCYYFFNQNGEIVDSDWNSRVLAIDIQDIQHIPNVIGIAEGVGKADSIHAMIHANVINILVTDADTARALLEKA